MEAPIVEVVDNSAIFEPLLTQCVELLQQIYASILYCVGFCGALLVIFLLYKFLRTFF